MPARLISFEIERQRHAGFVGRAALLARLDQLLIEERVDRWIVVTGGPGMGKSALLAAWLARREAAGDAVPHHFIRRGWDDWDDPATLVGSLVAQIEARFPAQRDPAADPGMSPVARLAATLGRLSEHELVPRGERLVVLIDGLDEYDPPPGPPPLDPLAAFLPDALPRGVAVVCASRPRHPYVDMLATRGALVQLDLDDERGFAADNAATVRAFWDQAAPELGLGAPFIADAVERAGGNLQHAAMLRMHLAGLPPAQRRVEDIPRGLAASIAGAWDRIATTPLVVDGLGILCAAREPLTLDELGAVAGWTGELLRRAFLGGARELLIETRRPDAVPEYRLHHDSIRTQIARAVGPAALCDYHRALAHELATWPAREATARRYALRHALLHRAEAGEWADAWRIASDTAFLEAKCRELGAGDVEADVARTADRCSASGDEALRKRFADLARALSRESHWLRVAPDATAALVWNQLRRSGWTTTDLDRHLQLAPGASFLRVRHVATRESPAFARTLAGHAHTVTACAVTPDGRRVVSASGDDTLKVWDLATGQAIATLRGHTGWVSACAVTSDGRRVVSASWDRTLRVWDLATGQTIAILRGHIKSLNACAVTADGERAVSASTDGTLKVWDLATGQPIATLRGHTGWVNACALTPDGRHVVSTSDDRTLKVWNLATEQPIVTLPGRAACAVTPDGRRVVASSPTGMLEIWDLATGQSIAALHGPAPGVTACAVTPDGRCMVSASQDGTLKVWDLASGQPVAILEGHTAGVTACAVALDGRRVVSASTDRTLKVWDLAAQPDGRRVVSASADGTLEVRGLATGQLTAAVTGHTGRVTACAVTPDERRAVSASADGTLEVWDLATGQPVVALQGHTQSVEGCAVTPDGQRVVSTSWDGTLRLWDLATGQLVAGTQLETCAVIACAVTPDGQCAISASRYGTLEIWHLASRRRVRTLLANRCDMTAFAMTPDGRRAIAGASNGTLGICDLATGQPLATLKNDGHVTACAVTPDGQRVVAASSRDTLTIWDLAAEQAIATLRCDAGLVTACAVTPDGRHVVAASDNGTLQVWDLATGARVLTHRASAGYCAVAASRTGIVAGDTTGSMWLLDGPPDRTNPAG